jgi:hypothetical protein
MKTLKLSFGLTILALGLIFFNSETQAKARQEAKPDDHSAASARSFVDLLAKLDFAAAEKTFDEDMKKGLPEDKLESAWSAVLSQYGSLKKQVSLRQGKAGGYDIVEVKCEFEKGLVVTRLAFNKEGQISGLFFVPAK